MIYRYALIMAFVLALLGACASEPVAAPTPDPEAFSNTLEHFESAYGELDQAIRATPDWEKQPTMAIRVRGLADLAIYRAEKLRPFVAQELISDTEILLIKTQTRQRARIEQINLPGVGGSHLENSSVQLRAANQERAYHRILLRIETLETLTAHGATFTPWLEEYVLGQDRADLATISNTSWADVAMWRRISPSPDGFQEDWARAQAVFDRLEGRYPE